MNDQWARSAVLAYPRPASGRAAPEENCRATPRSMADLADADGYFRGLAELDDDRRVPAPRHIENYQSVNEAIVQGEVKGGRRMAGLELAGTARRVA